MRGKITQLLSLSLFFLMTNCQVEGDFIDENNHYKKHIHITEETFGNLMLKNDFKEAFSKLPKKKEIITSSLQGKTIMEERYGFVISVQPAKIIEFKNKISYTFLITRDNQVHDYFENLIIEIDSLNQTRAVIAKYTPKTPVNLDLENKVSFNGDIDVKPITYNSKSSTTNRMDLICVDFIRSKCTGDPWDCGGTVCGYTTTSYCDWVDDGSSNGSSGGGGVSGNGGSGGSSSNISTTPVVNYYYYHRDDNYLELTYAQISLLNKQSIDLRKKMLETEDQGFIVWSLNYLSKNPDVTSQQFENWFMGTLEGQDGEYDAAYWENPNLTFPQQNLPTYNKYYAGMARFPNGDLMTGADNVYGLVGGAVLQARSEDPIRTENTCALKVSIALNRSGVVIPDLPGKTVEGAGEFKGKYFFLNARSLNSWMRETFGTDPATSATPINANHRSFTATDGGANGVDFPYKLKNMKGIYSMITTKQYSRETGTSGHSDLLFTDSKNLANCVYGCFFNKPIERIDVWILN